MNNPLLKLGLVVVLVLGAGFFGVTTYRKKVADYEHRLDLERIRKEYLERAPVARQMAEPEKYRFEQQRLFKWYFDELNEHYNRFPAFKNYDRFAEDLAQRHKARKVKDGEYEQYQERFKATKSFWEMARGNKYEPVFTAGDKGIRLDIYEVKAVSDAKEPKLRLSFALYGTQRKWTADSSAGTRVLRLNVNASFHELTVSGLDKDGKEIRRMSAAGDPPKIDNPERFIEEFPPGVVFGSYDIPKIPAECESVELTFDLSTRSVLTGEEVPVKLVWKQPLPADWKLPAGVDWENAQEQVREDLAPQDAKKKGR